MNDRTYIAGEPELLANTLLHISNELNIMRLHVNTHDVIELPSDNPVYVEVLSMQVDSIRKSIDSLTCFIDAIELAHIVQDSVTVRVANVS